jgi:hypothetical protein
MPRGIRSNANNSIIDLQNSSVLDVNVDVQDKLKRFFPLKTHLTGSEARITTVTALVINSTQNEKIEFKKAFTNYVVEVISTNKTGAILTLPTMNVDSVFIEVSSDDNHQETVEIIKDLHTISRNTTPIYICFPNLVNHQQFSQQKRKLLDAGATDCFEKSFITLEEDVLADIYNIVSYDYYKNTIYQIENGRENSSSYHFNPSSSIFSSTMTHQGNRTAASSVNRSDAAKNSSLANKDSTVSASSSTSSEDPSNLRTDSSTSVSVVQNSTNGNTTGSNNSPNTNGSPPDNLSIEGGAPLPFQPKYSSNNSVENYNVGAEKLSSNLTLNSNGMTVGRSVSSMNSGNANAFSVDNYSKNHSMTSSSQGYLQNTGGHGLSSSSLNAGNPYNVTTQSQSTLNNNNTNNTYNKHTSKSVKPGNISDSDDKDHIVGTIHFIAPEILKNHRYSDSSDWWACGITFYYCVTKRHLFGGEDRHAIFDSIRTENINLSALDQLRAISSLSSPAGLKDLIGGILNRNIYHRNEFIKKVHGHEFFAGIPFETLSKFEENRFHPPSFPTKKFNVADKANFYGDTPTNPNPNQSNPNAVNNSNKNNNNNTGNTSNQPNGTPNNNNSSDLNNSLNNANFNSNSGSFGYQNIEFSRKLSYNKMKMDLRNDFLINRFKKQKKRLSDYRKKKIQHLSIKHQKKLKQERANNANQSNGASNNSNNSGNHNGSHNSHTKTNNSSFLGLHHRLPKHHFRAEQEMEDFVIPSYESFYNEHYGKDEKNNNANNAPNNYDLPINDSYYYDLDYYYANNYYSSRQNAQLQYISQQQAFSDSMSVSENSGHSLYSDKTIREEENEDEESEEPDEQREDLDQEELEDLDSDKMEELPVTRARSSPRSKKSSQSKEMINADRSRGRYSQKSLSTGHQNNKNANHIRVLPEDLDYSSGDDNSFRQKHNKNTKKRSKGKKAHHHPHHHLHHRRENNNSTVRDFHDNDDSGGLDRPKKKNEGKSGDGYDENDDNHHHGDSFLGYSVGSDESHSDSFCNYLDRDEEEINNIQKYFEELEKSELERSIQHDEIENDKSMSIPLN